MIRNNIRRRSLIIQSTGEARNFRSGILKSASRFPDIYNQISTVAKKANCRTTRLLGVLVEYYFKRAANTDYYLILLT